MCVLRSDNMNNEKRLCFDRLLLLMLKVVLWQKSSSRSLGLVCPRVLQTKNEKSKDSLFAKYFDNWWNVCIQLQIAGI